MWKIDIQIGYFMLPLQMLTSKENYSCNSLQASKIWTLSDNLNYIDKILSLFTKKRQLFLKITSMSIWKMFLQLEQLFDTKKDLKTSIFQFSQNYGNFTHVKVRSFCTVAIALRCRYIDYNSAAVPAAVTVASPHFSHPGHERDFTW